MNGQDKKLSTEAKAVYASHWQHINTSEVVFQRPWVISAPFRKGLNELVDLGLLTVERYNHISDALVWKPTNLMTHFRNNRGVFVSRKWLEKHGNFPVIVECEKPAEDKRCLWDIKK